MKPVSKTNISLLLVSALLIAGASCQKTGSIFNSSGDVGDPKLKGSFSFDNSTGVYTLSGAGTNMWLQTDEFFMAWKKISGDFSLSAKVAFEGEGVNAHRKMGLIIRESLAGVSVYADVAIHGDGLTSLQYRDATAGETKEVVAQHKGADHITLERIGERIVMKTGIGGFTDVASGEIELNLPAECYVGLFVCSHEEDVLETAHFSEVRFKP
ncbi:MAG: hypothetical protein LBJ58_02660 [Tannerellaceae bacterium]|jgi:hypothetical protein|nr:hypothetical protein [Tannerellaceae bacterium]